MKVLKVFLVLFIALVCETWSLKVHGSDGSESVLSQQYHHNNVRQRQGHNVLVDNHVTGQQASAAIPSSPSSSSLNTNYAATYGADQGQGQQDVSPSVQPQYQYYQQYIQPNQQTSNTIQQQQPQQPVIQQLPQQQQQHQFYYPQQQQQQYPSYYPQHQFATYATDKTFGGMGGGGQDHQGGDDGILGGLTSMFSGIFDMFGLGLGNDDHMMGGGNSMGYGQELGHGQQGMDGLGGIGGGLGGGLGGFIKGKKAGWLARGAVGLLLSPVILPIIILWIALIVLVIYFIPIPVIDVNGSNDGNKRSYKSELYSPVGETMRLAKSVLQSDECVERLTCEIGRFSKSYLPQEWIQRKMDMYKGNKWVHRVSRSLKSARGGSNCKQYSCPSITVPAQRIRSLFSGSQKTSAAAEKSNKATFVTAKKSQ